ncbi:phage tail protein [Lactococcus garvieae]|uniref:phage tail protein n=2 Tax=Lactococcus garvieae TaxID=1363 RepID=UPI001F6015CB|nr:phage tail protein [Lactococcus garvieae]MCI3860531.1 phage tail protein [Lactococcus garvieae]
MQISIHDSSMERVAYMNNDLPEALHYFDDNWHRYLAEGSSTFDFKVLKNHPDASLITSQGYISFTYEGVDYLFVVMIKKEDDYTLEVQGDNLNLELINEQLNPFKNTVAHTLDWYIWNAAGLSSNVVAIGNNPFTDTKVLTFEQEETKLARLIAIIQAWNGEFEFITSLKNNGTLNELTLNIYPESGVGEVREDVTLYYGQNIKGVSRSEDKTNLFNAVAVTDSNGKYKWNNLEKTIKNSDGNIEFYKKVNEVIAYAPISRDLFPSQIKSGTSDQWIRKDFKIEAKSIEHLWDYALTQLKENAYPKVTYEVEATSTAVRSELGNDKRLNIGDTVITYDSNFDQDEGGLILSTRVSEQEISFSNPLNDKLTFSNFVKLKSRISDDLIDRMNDLINQNTPYRLEIYTDNGTIFKNSAGQTTLSAHIFFGQAITESEEDAIQWYKDGEAIVLGTETSWTVNAEDIDGTSVYYYEATVGEKVFKSLGLTITDVSDGLDGVDGRSIVSVEQKYQITNSETAPTEPWEDSTWIPDTPFPDKEHPYLWQMTRTTYNKEPLTSDVTVLAGTYGKGEDGKPGDDAWAVNMTSSSVTLPADNEGKVLSYANSGNSFTVISGSGGYLTPRASSATLGPNEFQVTATATNCKVGVSTILTETHQVSFANISEIPDGVGRTAFIEFAIKVNIAGQIAHVYKTQNFATATGGKPGPPGDAGEPVTVTGQKIDYASWPSATEFPDDGAEWVSDIPIVPEGEYLWTRMIIQFSDGSESRPFYSIGNQIDLNAVYSKIEQTKDGILQTVGENYTSNDEFHQLQTTFEQTADSFQMGFDNVSKFMDVGGDLTEDEFEVESSFIKFDATGITLGQSSSPIQLILSPTQLVFDQAGYPVAVMSNNKLTINNAEIGEFLKLGNFEFIPQTNGNLSFMKVG